MAYRFSTLSKRDLWLGSILSQSHFILEIFYDFLVPKYFMIMLCRIHKTIMDKHSFIRIHNSSGLVSDSLISNLQIT